MCKLTVRPNPWQVRYAQGLRVVVALADCPAGAGGLQLVPGSHNSGLPRAPAEVLRGALPELCVQPVLAAGDAVLLAPGLVALLRPWTLPTPQRLLHSELIAPQTRPSAGIPPVEVPEPWHERLTPLEKALCGVHWPWAVEPFGRCLLVVYFVWIITNGIYEAAYEWLHLRWPP